MTSPPSNPGPNRKLVSNWDNLNSVSMVKYKHLLEGSCTMSVRLFCLSSACWNIYQRSTYFKYLSCLPGQSWSLGPSPAFPGRKPYRPEYRGSQLFLVQALITTNHDAIRLRVWKLFLTLLNLTKRMQWRNMKKYEGHISVTSSQGKSSSWRANLVSCLLCLV